MKKRYISHPEKEESAVREQREKIDHRRKWQSTTVWRQEGNVQEW